MARMRVPARRSDGPFTAAGELLLSSGPLQPAAAADGASGSGGAAASTACDEAWALPQLCQRQPLGFGDAVDALAMSADGARLFTAGGRAGSVRVWDARAPWRAQPLHVCTPGHPGGVFALVVAADDRACFSAGRDGEIRHWSAEGALLTKLQGHGEGGVTALVRGGDVICSGGDEGKIRVWHAGTGEAGAVIRAQGCRVTALCLSSDAARVAVGGFDRLVRLFGVTTGERLGELSGHGGWVSALAWTPDGLTLLSGSYDGDVRVWRTDPALPAPTLHGVLRGGADAAAAAAPAGFAAAAAAPGAAPEDRMVSALLLEEEQAAPPAGEAADGDADGDVARRQRVYVGTMDGTVALWELRGACRRVGAGRVASRAAVCALAPCADAGGGAAPLCASAHRDGSLRAWRPFAADAEDAGAGAPGASATEGLEAAWTLPGAHADWATQLARCVTPAMGALPRGMLLASAGEDGALATWRVALPREWSRAAHAAFPDGFRAAARTFLLVLHRLAGGSEAADAPPVRGVAALRIRGRAGRAKGAKAAALASASSSPMSPVSPEPSPLAASAQRRSRRALAAPGDAPAPASAAGGQLLAAPQLAPHEEQQQAPLLRLHGATRDALVDLVVVALAAQVYPEGTWKPRR